MTGALDWSRDGAHWPHRGASRFVEAGGCAWHVQVLRGAPGQPVLWLLHGTGAASHSWRALMALLAPHATLVVPDLPGHGFSGPLRGASLPTMARSLAALADALALPPTAVLGHSAGCALAVRAVLDGHLAPQQLVGINAALLPFEGLAGRVFAPMARLMARQAWVPWLFARRAGDAAAVQRLVAATGSTLDAQGLALYARLMRSPAHVAGALAMMADWDLDSLWQELPRLPAPLLLLAGGQDGTVPPAQAQRVRLKLPPTRVQLLDGLGHLAHEEAPQRVADALAVLGVAGLHRRPPRQAA
ncbi:alpha/beta fold hydrolase BchO [Pseudaquabacterium pictum]|uniref:Alpha/beta hydrolase n=1 Tax=Pseudaquabacterium pictum TaxID=2315236 RepID=A0A480AV06_9BURK|nr:alpha/beta fold hydrolase BchO [Rubrivivax pictus]GCL65364.1 alpha/beta hydrolase [Rubrivivax pictus]